MRFKNFRPKAVIAVATFGGHSIHVESGEERDLPEHLHELAYSNGLVPMDDVESMMEKEDQLKASNEAKQSEKEAEALRAEEARHEALRKASEKSDEEVARKRSEAAKKAAATRKAKSNS